MTILHYFSNGGTLQRYSVRTRQGQPEPHISARRDMMDLNGGLF